MNPTVRRMLEIRRDLALSSVRKYVAFDEATTDDDPWLRGCFQFYGAQRTGRWAGRIIQPHNLPSRGVEGRPEPLALLREWIREGGEGWARAFIDLEYDSLAEGLKACIRPTIAAPDGYKLIVADLSSIETVKTGWATECDPLLKIYREGRCAYRTFAMDIYEVAYDAVTKSQRTEAKPVVLGCGYGMGRGSREFMVDQAYVEKHPKSGRKVGDVVDATGLIAYAQEYGIDLDEDRSQFMVNLYRAEFEEVPEFWKAIEKAVKYVIKYREAEVDVGPFTIRYRKPALHLRLPSGRELIYMQPATRPIAPVPGRRARPTITYMNYDGSKRSWYRHRTWGGKLTENVIQAIARDYLAHGMLNAAREGFTIIGHVHDELLTLVPEDDPRLTVQLLEQCMADNPDWCPGSPVSAEGWEGKFYRKD